MTQDLRLSTRPRLPCPRCASAIQHEADCLEAAKAEIERLRDELQSAQAELRLCQKDAYDLFDQRKSAEAEIARLRTRAEIAEELAAQYAARGENR